MKKVLIANRGEIARRVIRTLKKMNIATVAVYSDADKDAPHVKEADEAVYLGASPSSESYLNQDKILDYCKKLGVEGIHPGYGFLSENAGFARKVKAAGIKLIGPSPESMEVMGDKLSAKQAVKEFGVPLVPGVDHAITDVNEAKKIAEQVGYPILIKASAGGGGKGMRLVQNSEEFEEQMNLAQSEARNSFGDDAVFIEKFVTKPRHIEIQIIADKHGNVVCLGERECVYSGKDFSIYQSGLFDALSKRSLNVKRIAAASGLPRLVSSPDRSILSQINSTSPQLILSPNSIPLKNGDGSCTDPGACFGYCGPGCIAPGMVATVECLGHDLCVCKYGHAACVNSVPAGCGGTNVQCYDLTEAALSWVGGIWDILMDFWDWIMSWFDQEPEDPYDPCSGGGALCQT
jgi:D-alanine-D-alanine ligase-like ATP-grasp enzyme